MFRSAWSHLSSWRWTTRYLWSQVQNSARYDARETDETGTHCCRARWSRLQGAGRTENMFMHCGSPVYIYMYTFVFLPPQRCCCRGQPGQDVVGVLLVWSTSASSHPAGHACVGSPLLLTLRHGSDCRSDAVRLVGVLVFCEMSPGCIL